jgi:BlaI family transcriptional regulator, penicillinase repressor
MEKRSPLPKSELEIARIVWELKEATVRQVLDALPTDRELDFWTVQTYLRRLKTKGYLKSKLKGRTNVYSPRIAPDQVVNEVVVDFLDRMFDGEALPLMNHLIEDRGLTDDEIDCLQATLEKLKRKKP